MAWYNSDLTSGGTGESTEVLQSELEVVKDTLGYTAGKNLLENTETTTTLNGVTFTVNDNKSITVNGTASGNSSLYLNREVNLPNGEYILSGCPEGGGVSSYYLEILYIDGRLKSLCRDMGQGATFVINDSNNAFALEVRIIVLSGQTVNNLTFYPMIRKSDEPDKRDVDTRLEELKSALEWKLHTTTTGNNPATLPTSFKEILLIVKSTYSNVDKIYDSRSCYLTKEVIDIGLQGKSGTSYMVVNDYVSSNVLATWRILADKTVGLVSLLCGNTSDLYAQSTSTTYIYYR